MKVHLCCCVEVAEPICCSLRDMVGLMLLLDDIGCNVTFTKLLPLCVVAGGFLVLVATDVDVDEVVSLLFFVVKVVLFVVWYPVFES